MKVTGKNVVVFVKVGSDRVLYACATSATFTVNTDIIETSISGQGKFATFLPTKNSFTGVLEGVMSFETDGKLSLQDLRQRQISQEILFLKYQRTAGTDSYTEEGEFIITSSSDTGAYEDMNVFTIDMQGTGPLTQSSTVPPAPESFPYYYGSTDINTVVDPEFGTLFPSESEFIDSVDTVFANGEELTGTSTGQVSIADFGGSSTDRVRFLQVDKEYTVWSEVGNPFQQNQPIDQAYNFLSGNVWFKSEREGMPLYMTYSQTTFTGAIIFE